MRLNSATWGDIYFDEDDEEAQDFELSPGYGFHWFFYQKRLIWLDREALNEKMMNARRMPEKITLRTIGRDQGIIRRIILEAQKTTAKVDGITVRTWEGDYWRNMGLIKKRPMNSIVLRPGRAKRMIADATVFLASEDWYADRGIPYRRGWLLYGSPGTGKTSFVIALAGLLNMPIYVLNLNAVSTDGALANALSSVSKRAVLLIEDVDALNSQITHKRSKKQTKNAEDRLSTSGLLNAIDGVMATEGRLLVMTTNHPDKLDPALTRAGRIDLKEEFELADRDDAWNLFCLFFGPINYLRQDFLTSFGPRRREQPAQLQELFIRHRDDPAAVIDELRGVAAIEHQEDTDGEG